MYREPIHVHVYVYTHVCMCISWVNGKVNLPMAYIQLHTYIHMHTHTQALDYADIKIGSVIKGKVVKMDTFGCIVSLSSSGQSVRGLIPPQHLSDASLKNPEKTFTPGKQVYMYTYICMYVCMYVCMAVCGLIPPQHLSDPCLKNHVCMYVCIYIYIYIYILYIYI